LGLDERIANQGLHRGPGGQSRAGTRQAAQPAQKLASALAILLVLTGCGEPQSWADLQKHLQGLAADERDAAVEKFIVAKGGTPIVENQTRLVFLAKDVNGQPPRIVGDFNAWAVTPQGTTCRSAGGRARGTSWSHVALPPY
jgi:hypothetical protein